MNRELCARVVGILLALRHGKDAGMGSPKGDLHRKQIFAAMYGASLRRLHLMAKHWKEQRA